MVHVSSSTRSRFQRPKQSSMRRGQFRAPCVALVLIFLVGLAAMNASVDTSSMMVAMNVTSTLEGEFYDKRLPAFPHLDIQQPTTIHGMDSAKIDQDIQKDWAGTLGRGFTMAQSDREALDGGTPSFFTCNATTIHKISSLVRVRQFPSSYPLSAFLSGFTSGINMSLNRNIPTDDKPINSLPSQIHGVGAQTILPSIVCEFVPTTFAFHFPHAMQQLLSCWSLWQQLSIRAPAPKNKSAATRYDEKYQRAFLIPQDWYRQIDRRSPFISGFLNVLQKSGIVVVDSVENITRHHEHHQQKQQTTVVIAKPIIHSGFRMAAVDDARTLKQETVKYLDLPNNPTRCRQTATGTKLQQGVHKKAPSIPDNTQRAENNSPIIAILNRRGPRRHLLNSNNISIQLWKELQLPGPPLEVYFEGRSFREQVLILSNIDILISPHGAQLTGIVYMPKCGSVIEIFPKGYSVPHFYGSLASLSGLNYSYIYIGENETEETLLGMATPAMRSKSQGVNLCVPPSVVFDAVGAQIDAWRLCCI